MRHVASRFLRLAALAATPLALGGCATPLSTLDPAGPAAANIATLWWIMFWGSVTLFALVLGLLTLSLVRPALISRITPTQWIIGGGVIMPLPILVVLLVSALLLSERLRPPSDGSGPMRIEARASQWQWRFSYPDNPGVGDSDVLYLPAGQPVDIVLIAEDVIHSFWIPRLGGKMDAIPGRRNVVRLEADKPGIYRGICAEYCGQGHETMEFVAEAQDPARFTATLEAAQ
ncbi:MAG: cytochrome c oxidase subunit II [Devosia sp.]